ncbi:MAG: thioredoxin family protein [Deltaproteobacteria bacterium]
MKTLTLIRFVFLLTTMVVLHTSTAMAAVQAPVPGMVTMVDLGATSCIPCRMMAPILEELKKEYRGRAEIIFIDVWQNKDEGKRFGIRAIPTQIFFDKKGREVFRHTGFMEKQEIINQLEIILKE